MSMETLKAALLATTLGAVALLPAATVMTLASVESAYAKGGNGNGNGGNGKGGGRSSEVRGGGEKAERGGGKPSWAGKGNRESGQATRGGGDPVGNFLKRLTGQENKGTRKAARATPTRSAPNASIAPAPRPTRSVGGTQLHPSELGNMNGALNANMNAVLAHVRNGNTNGPVGQMAALAVAHAAAAESGELLASEDGRNYRLFQAVVAGEGYDSLAQYLASGQENDTIDGALEAFEDFDTATYDAVVGATETEADLLSAQESILAYWNKNPDPAPEIDEELEQPLLDSLMSRFDGHEEEIEAAIAERDARATEKDHEEAACDGIENCEADEDIAAIE